MITNVQTQPFAIPMTNMNLAPSEALNQIMDNLNHLNMIVNEAVNTIHIRIKQESDLLASISNRINEACKKTARIASNSNKSTTVYSLPTYPEIKNNPGINVCPLVNKAPNHTYNYAIKPQRNYNLSIKQRNEPPTNIDTIHLLHSLSTKTHPITPKPGTLQNTKIPEWVTSVADCVVFGTKCNAYKPSPTRYQKRQIYHSTRYKKRRRNIEKHYDSIAPAPPSIADTDYNIKTQRKTYGERIKYRYVLDRENMPTFKVDWNVFHDEAAMDIKWTNDNDEMDQVFIPSDVLNKNDVDIHFEYGDDVKPPTVKNEVDTNESDYDTDNKCVHDGDNTVVDHDEEEKESGIMQPLIIEDDAQNKSLQNKQDEEDEDNDVGFVIDSDALQNAKDKLKAPQKTKEKRKSDNIFEEMEKRRQYFTDTDDEDGSDSFN